MTNTSVHRLLDEAFAGLPATADVQDLKDEIRANLLDRVAELTGGGVAPDEAARRAVDELGDVRALVEDASGSTADAGWREPVTPGAAVSAAAVTAALQHRVPPHRRYVAGIVLASVAILLAFVPFAWVMVSLAGNPDVGWYLPLALGAPLLTGPAVGWIVAASLARETPRNYGMPRRRAISYGLAWTLLVVGLIVGAGGYLLFASPALGFRTGMPLLVVGGAWLAYLVATQTNRHKPWVLEQAREHAQVGDRFEKDPAAAARFGIYATIVWTLTAAAFLAVGFTVSWLWALLPALLGVAVFMLLLATMLFGAKHTRQD